MVLYKNLDVGCGAFLPEKKEKDWLYLDVVPFPNIDVVRDLEKGLPFGDETFERIKAHHIIEHLKDLIFVMNEFWRVLKKDGVLDIAVPAGVNTWIDPTHIRAIGPHGLDFFQVENFNSLNAGVVGFFDRIELKAVAHNGDTGDIRGYNFLLRKREAKK